jgi:hypothetical protein
MRATVLSALAAVLLACGSSVTSARASAETGASDLIVIPESASGSALSYFKLSLGRGGSAQAGAIGLRNASSKRIRVVLSAVAGQTLGTLGSTYAAGATRRRGPSRWLGLSKRVVAISPGATVLVPVSVAVPRRTHPGDYLAGVSVEALDQQVETARHGVAVASAVRYAIGVEVTVPGRRRPGIRFTGAELQRQPAGLVFLLDARNTGNVILQGVHGSALITSGRRVVAQTPLGPGTFVTGTSIAYPVPAFRAHPSKGTRFHIRAVMRYAGGIARLDTTLSFGSREAALQQQYVRPHASHGGTAWWKIALLAGVIAYALVTTVLLLLRRRRGSTRGAGAGDPLVRAEPKPPSG